MSRPVLYGALAASAPSTTLKPPFVSAPLVADFMRGPTLSAVPSGQVVPAAMRTVGSATATPAPLGDALARVGFTSAAGHASMSARRPTSGAHETIRTKDFMCLRVTRLAL